MIKISKFKKKIAENLLRIEAVFLRPEEPFIWASGIKSPVYCDNRLILTAPEIREDVEFYIAEVIREEFPDAEVIMGTATAGIAHAAIIAHIMNLPMGYVRTGAKTHGRTNRIEGKLEKGQKVVVVEDLVSTGGSSVDAVEALREAGADVLGIVSIMTYGMKKGKDRMKEADVKCISLTDFDTVAEIAAKHGYINEKDIERLMKFRDNPSDESWFNK
ncbi:MAG TPA: orotate phosphoribosyltransferase [Mogibacterium sp.]|nr:orotate phosphoribosyltransferase [Mogibacterium sp.]